MWYGDRAPSHDRVSQRMKQILLEQAAYPYLSKNAMERLRQARETALQYGFGEYNLFDMGKKQVGILPWLGHRNYRTLRNIILYYMKENRASLPVYGQPPYFMIFSSESRDAASFFDALKAVFEKGVNPYDFFNEDRIRSEKKHYEYKVPKYDRFVPNVLLKRQLIEDYVDVGYLKEQVYPWRVNRKESFP
jgi:ATP-dependent Lhr-like helicase